MWIEFKLAFSFFCMWILLVGLTISMWDKYWKHPKKDVIEVLVFTPLFFAALLVAAGCVKYIWIQ